jgi:hypothetical protein
MTVREAFERGTDTFNAHDLDGFAEVLADEVVFEAPGGIRGEGKAACAEFLGGWFGAFPDAHVHVHRVHIVDDIAVEEGTFTGTHDGVLHSPTGDFPRRAAPSGSATSRCSASGTASTCRSTSCSTGSRCSSSSAWCLSRPRPALVDEPRAASPAATATIRLVDDAARWGSGSWGQTGSDPGHVLRRRASTTMRPS